MSILEEKEKAVKPYSCNKKHIFHLSMKPILLSFFTILLFVGFLFLEHQKVPEGYRITFFDVNLGDSALIQSHTGKNILVDTSSTGEFLEKLSKYLPLYEKKIDVLILSHGDLDHIGGAIDLLNRYKVQEVWFSGAQKQSPYYDELFSLIENKQISYRILEDDTDYQIEEMFFDVLYPFENISYLEDHGNNESVVFKFSILDQSILFTGDIEGEVEKQLLASGEDLHADILKVAHHGSKTSSTQSFIEAVDPESAVAQADEDNRFGHPHKDIVERFQSNNVTFLQTGLEGDVSFCIAKEQPNFIRCNR